VLDLVGLARPVGPKNSRVARDGQPKSTSETRPGA
jgi:hypothetical protein